MQLFVEMEPKKQKELLESAQNISKKSPQELQRYLGIKKAMFYLYKNEKNLLPFEVYKKIIRLIDKTVLDFDFNLREIKHTKKSVHFPELDENLSEFIGALAGDGNIEEYEVCLTCHGLLDYEYVKKRMDNLCKELFGLTPKYFEKHHYIKLRLYSKKLSIFLIKEYGLPLGKKKGRLHIPGKILENKKYLTAYLRGLFDTDGSFYKHHKNTGVVSIISGDTGFIEEIKSALNNIRFYSTSFEKNIYIYQKDDVDRFFAFLKPGNKKHTIKYQIFKNTSKVPSNQEMLNLMHR